MRIDRNPGIVLPALFLAAGAYLLHESSTHFGWYAAIYLVAGATVAAMGLMMGSWTIRRHLPIRRTEHHAKGHHQIGTQ
jgi:hypothetical protein